MTRKMLPEEKALRDAIDVYTVPNQARPITRLIPALIRAIREECAKVAERVPITPYGAELTKIDIVDAIRRGKKR